MKQLIINGLPIPVLELAVLITDSGLITHSELTPVSCYQRVKELTDCSGTFARHVVLCAVASDIGSDTCIAVTTQGLELEISRLA